MPAYLDNAATTRVCPQAAQAALEAMTGGFGNPSSGHAAGQAAAAGEPGQLMAVMERLMRTREGAELVERIENQARQAGLE